jgi:hypothetical protein
VGSAVTEITNNTKNVGTFKPCMIVGGTASLMYFNLISPSLSVEVLRTFTTSTMSADIISTMYFTYLLKRVLLRIYELRYCI